ncbi:hypothetical protein [Candidatus Scalindua japonica]|nr:hypothetical protein [Candidatus Scalindua japonica]
MKMAFKQQDTIDFCSWAILKKNNLVNGEAPSTDEKMYDILSNKSHTDRIKQKSGPLLYYKEHGNLISAKIDNLIFADRTQWRKTVYSHFIEMRPGHEIGNNTLVKLRKIEETLFSKNWFQAALDFYDIINTDWLCNLMGLQQANEMNYEEERHEFESDVYLPSIASVESIGVGALQPSSSMKDYIKDFGKICEDESNLCTILDKYFYKYGHIPLCYKYSLYSMLDSFFVKYSYNQQQRWESLWLWADSKESPLPRYHVCCYFVRNSNDISEEQLKILCNELFNIIHMPVDKGVELQWTLAWKLRCNTAKHFGQFFEGQLPGANTERIYSQAWWMAEKVANIFSNSSEGIVISQKYMLPSGEFSSDMVWQMTRPRTQSSSIRYATLLTRSLWAVAIIPQIDNKFFDYICKTKPPKVELFVNSVIDSLIGCFPLIIVDQANSVYAYDQTCIKACEYLSVNYPDTEIKQQFSTLLSIVKQQLNTDNLIEQMSKISESDDIDQLITVVAMRVMAFTDLIPDENEVWKIYNEDWLEKMFLSVNERISYTIIISLIEIMLQKQNKWAWQLPHLFSIVCKNHINSEEIKKLAFACVVVSSICSDTCSALKRTLLENKSDISELQNEWSKRLREIYHIVPDCTKSRLRPAILCLDS